MTWLDWQLNPLAVTTRMRVKREWEGHTWVSPQRRQSMKIEVWRQREEASDDRSTQIAYKVMCPVSCPSMCLPVKQRDRSSGHKWDAKRGDTRWEKQAINVMGDMTYQQIANSLMYQRLTDWLLIPNLDEDSCVVSRIIQLFFSLEVCIPFSKHVFLCRDSCSRIPRVHYSPWQENCTNFVSLHWSLSLHKQRKKSVILRYREKEREGCTLRVKVDLCLAWLSCLILLWLHSSREGISVSSSVSCDCISVTDAVMRIMIMRCKCISSHLRIKLHYAIYIYTRTMYSKMSSSCSSHEMMNEHLHEALIMNRQMSSRFDFEKNQNLTWFNNTFLTVYVWCFMKKKT